LGFTTTHFEFLLGSAKLAKDYFGKYFTVIPVCPFKIVASNEDVLKGYFHLELKDLFHHHKLLSVQLEQGMLPANHQQ
jgi:hypothetical protein